MTTEVNCLVAQSGGPTTVINSSLAGIISKALDCKIDHIYGAINGIQGVLDNRITDLTAEFKYNKNSIELLKNTPSMYLGSCRYRLDSDKVNSGDYITIFNRIANYNIKYFFYIGGNDSMDTVLKLSHYAQKHNYDVNIIGIPKTIDNDLMCIDHTPGFGSAAKYIASSILEISHDTYIYNTQSVSIVEIMGRNAGWLTAASVLARNSYSNAPHLIYIPEKPFSTKQFLIDVKKKLKERNHIVIAVSEGIKDTKGDYISACSENVDQFGHAMLSGTGNFLETLVQKHIGCKVRSIELNVLQRCAAHISSLTDINEAFKLGEFAVSAALNGETGKMVSHKRVSNSPYELSYFTASIDDIANKEKTIPLDWINDEGNDVTSDLINYVKPLIQGEAPISYEEGIPQYLPVKHLIS